MRFSTTHSVTISLEELENLLPESAVKLITDECNVESISDLYLGSVHDCKEIVLFSL